MENSMEGPQKIKIEQPYDSPVPLLRIYPEEMKMLTWKDTQSYVHNSIVFNSQGMETT